MAEENIRHRSKVDSLTQTQSQDSKKRSVTWCNSKFEGDGIYFVCLVHI